MTEAIISSQREPLPSRLKEKHTDVPNIREQIAAHFARFYEVENPKQTVKQEVFNEKIDTADICQVAQLAPGQPFFERLNIPFKGRLKDLAQSAGKRDITVPELVGAYSDVYRQLYETEGVREFSRLLKQPDSLARYLEHFGVKVTTAPPDERRKKLPERGKNRLP